MSESKGLQRYNGVEQDDEGAYVYYDEHIAALRRAKAEGMEELEQKYRKELWLNHGHHGLYGDDGEMQCIECHPYGATDYKRDPLDKIEHATFRARMARAAQIENEATK